MPFVALYPDGSIGATDGVALVHSSGAHDADVAQPLLVRPVRASLSSGSTAYRLSDCLTELVEVRPRSEATIDVSVETGARIPSIHKAVPGNLTPVAGEIPLFDSIIAGRLASDYGLKRGVWVKGPWSDRVYLSGVEEGDLVVLAGIRR